MYVFNVSADNPVALSSQNSWNRKLDSYAFYLPGYYKGRPGTAGLHHFQAHQVAELRAAIAENKKLLKAVTRGSTPRGLSTDDDDDDDDLVLDVKSAPTPKSASKAKPPKASNRSSSTTTSCSSSKNHSTPKARASKSKPRSPLATPSSLASPYMISQKEAWVMLQKVRGEEWSWRGS